MEISKALGLIGTILLCGFFIRILLFFWEQQRPYDGPSEFHACSPEYNSNEVQIWRFLTVKNPSFLYEGLKDNQRRDIPNINFYNGELQNANFMFANFSFICFNGVDVSGANFSYADLSSADMRNAKGLTAEQILSAKWYSRDGSGEPPMLPEALEKQYAIQEWLKTPAGEYPENRE